MRLKGLIPVGVACAAALAVGGVGVTGAGSASFDACVAPGGASGCSPTLQQAIGAVPDGGSIQLLAGTYNESVVVGKRVMIVGDGAASTILSGASGSPTLTVYTNGEVTMQGVTLTHPSGSPGTGLYNTGKADLTSVSVRANSVPTDGAGIVNFGTLSLTRSLVERNAAGGNGGGIVNGGAVSLTETRVSTNTATSFGGGIYDGGTLLNVVRSTIDGNSAQAGGAIMNFGTSEVIDTSTIANNQASVSGGGIAMGATALDLRGVTIAGNKASLGANLYADGAAARINATRTILADPAGGGQDCFLLTGAHVTSGGSNLDEDTSCALSGTGDRTGADPRLLPLGDNGGTTPTQALAPGSPAINNGGTTCTGSDQRGVTRPQRGACDIGAFEAGPDPIVRVTTPANNALFAEDQTVTAAYTCTDGLTGATITCTGTQPNGAKIDTTTPTLGQHTFKVTGTDRYGFTTTITTTYTVLETLWMGPQAMEGDLKVPPGTIVRAGYDFTIPGSHPNVTVMVVGGYVSFDVTCEKKENGDGGTFVVGLPDARTLVPAGSSAWYPSGDQKSPLVFQGSIPVPDLCHGGRVKLKPGGTFVAGFGSSTGTTKINVRWHYSANGSAGGWSGTKSIVGTYTP